MANSEKLDEVKVAAEAWAEYHRLNELAKASAKAANAAWEMLGLPDSGKEWAALAGIASGETAKVVVVNGNGVPLASGVISERMMPPRPASVSWVSPRL